MKIKPIERKSNAFKPIEFAIIIETKDELMDLYSRLMMPHQDFSKTSFGYEHINDDLNTELTDYLESIVEDIEDENS